MSRSFIVFHRHGHRAPALTIFPSGTNEIDWSSLLPSSEILANLCSQFPVVNHESNPTERDILSHPFGCLTQKGVDHLDFVGEELTSVIKMPKLLTSDIHIYATNYQRTQVSAQSLLTGFQLPSGLVIKVRKLSECSMSFYDANHDLSRKLIGETQETDDFKTIERSKEVLKLKSVLVNHFPLLCKANGRFDWMSAFDYFCCRRAHSLEIAAEVAPYEDSLRRLISSRFSLYYSHPQHLALAAVPLLRDLIAAVGAERFGQSLQGTTATVSEDKLTVFSGHDVNILTLLHSLGAIVLTEQSTYWPDYGCTVVFEASLGTPAAGMNTTIPAQAQSNPDESNVQIKVYLDGRPLRFDLSRPRAVMNAGAPGCLPPSSVAVSSVMSLAELRSLVDDLESSMTLAAPETV